MNARLAPYKFLLAPVSLGLLIPAVAIPWIAINFLGFHQFSPINILSEFYNPGTAEQNSNRFDIANLFSSYRDSYYSAIASLLMYFASIAGMILSVAWGAHRPKIALVAGILAITAAIVWMYSVQSVKDNFASQAALTGGIIGEEFKGHETTLADILIRLGSGQNFVAAGGAVGVFTYFAEKKLCRKSQTTTA